ncbi:hypothetical protein ACFWWM_34300 [Streptomyces sp. NPDC058682]|uniref:hypothetical protein n=1 Tax=Streptomyces sp. NPDC058682 TaxID=3346596 RepID=UPI0036460668
MPANISWGPSDVTGGPLDEVLAALRGIFPDLRVERLSVTWPADDDNVWFISREGGAEMQLDSHENGQLPFLLESDISRVEVDDAGLAVETLTAWLRG